MFRNTAEASVNFPQYYNNVTCTITRYCQHFLQVQSRKISPVSTPSLVKLDPSLTLEKLMVEYQATLIPQPIIGAYSLIPQPIIGAYSQCFLVQKYKPHFYNIQQLMG